MREQNKFLRNVSENIKLLNSKKLLRHEAEEMIPLFVLAAAGVRVGEVHDRTLSADYWGGALRPVWRAAAKTQQRGDGLRYRNRLSWDVCLSFYEP